ncbi:diacylglycerol kinase [Rappaport israeli]|uniref:diacylglycerol kinase n=1 Tax=Rappaport israeli TaxID=1839807 RepID=UPI000931F4CA|nr:diacylglycerol kinase [Rappaport israeli]
MDKSKSEKDYASKQKSIGGLKRIYSALHYSIDGFKAAWKEAAFRQLMGLHAVLILIACLIPFPYLHTVLLIVLSLVSLIVELLNTAIEAAVDHTSRAQHPLAKQAKDVGSAAQFLTLAMILFVWIALLIQLWR